VAKPRAAPTWGPTNVARHATLKSRGHHLRVIVRGEDVTDRCRYFDDTSDPPVAELFRVDDAGRKYRDTETGEPAMEYARVFTIRDVGTADR
jgi:hypothetical protein